MEKPFRYYLDLITILTQKELKIRYKNSFLGYLWSLANPLAFAGVFYIAFKVIMRVQMEDYPLFIITGLFPWQWISNSLGNSSTVFQRNSMLIKRVNISRHFLPLASTLHDMLHFIFSIPIILLLIFLYGKPFFFAYLYGIPVLILIQLTMVYGICLGVATVTLFFRDLERITSITLMITFYFTPIVYSPSMIPGDYLHLLYLNPAALLLVNWRELFYHGTLIPGYLFASFLYSLLFLFLGSFVYSKLRWRLAEVL